jgi:TonB family protein
LDGYPASNGDWEFWMLLRITTFLFAAAFFVEIGAAQQQEDCPKRTVISNGVCPGTNGNNCAQQESQPLVCYDFDPQYTEEAAKARVKGTVRLAATVESDGCAHNIHVISGIGYGLDEAAVSALEHFRFRKVSKPVRIGPEFNFHPRFSSTNPIKAPKCLELSGQTSRPAN